MESGSSSSSGSGSNNIIITSSSSCKEKHVQQRKQRKRWVVPLVFASALIAIFISSSSFFSSLYFLSPFAHSSDDNQRNHPVFVESKLRFINSKSSATTNNNKNPIPRLAYLISGSRGDGEALKRNLMAVYHPHNTYVLHLDLESSPSERLSLVAFVRDSPVFSRFANVRVIVKANLITYRGPTMVANTLHAAALLLKEGRDWDWFINLSASDYPLLTQDDLLYTFSAYPRHLNFIEHTSDIGWKEWHRAKPVIIDPGLYRLNKSDVFWITEKRSLPTAFKLFTGSAWMMLTRDFMEYCIWGWDNLPRTVLMYYANFLSSPEGYFQTVICNAEEYRTSTVNSDLHLISWDNPPKQHPHFLNIEDFPRINNTAFPFARKFRADDPVLDVIDKELLHRDAGGFTDGGWLEAAGEFVAVDLRPGPGAKKVKLLVDGLLADQQRSDKNRCI